MGSMATVNKDMVAAKEFVAKYNIQNIEVKTKKVAEVAPYTAYNLKYDIYKYEDYMTYNLINMYSMDVPESSFFDIIQRIHELDELMTDPESAKLIMEARFIYRLKHGSA